MKRFLLIIGAIVVIVGGYLILQRQPDVVDQPMTQQLCEEQGGTWGEMEIMRETGDSMFYQCECPNEGPWIKEGQIGSCQ